MYSGLCVVLMLVLLQCACQANVWDDYQLETNKAICELPPDYGRCSKYTKMWYYDNERRRCKTFIYSVCGGNANRFYTKRECEEFCRYDASVETENAFIRVGSFMHVRP
ncbi:kunitz-type serine protease inhibitor spermatin-like [Scaptodrosophila lebanonensis]|uniref:Kunitz-type serine protease inhibitor spermatin-like n=1 Tax=Drosophila lebanonensis TaxID=7225 RepID=A0A6J2T451_DROLE|nr:kunitz-type serine protease inhibitor spermatin-like [Scaptodrosophila lebanonensis]